MNDYDALDRETRILERWYEDGAGLDMDPARIKERYIRRFQFPVIDIETAMMMEHWDHDLRHQGDYSWRNAHCVWWGCPKEE